MSRRTRQTEHDSLDLLLDTICNTFGGVVFISLLVVILLNTTARQTSVLVPDTNLRQQFMQAEQERQSLTAELDQLREAIGNQESVMDLVVSAKALQLTEQLSETRETQASLLSMKSTLTGEVSAAQREINEMAAEESRRDDAISAAESRLQEITRRVEISVDQNARTAVIPKIVTSTRPPQTFFLKGGRLFGPRSLPNNPLNSSVFEIVEIEGRKALQERAGSGLPVDPTGKRNAKIKKRLEDDWLKSFYVKLFVWPDSYEHVEAVRVILDGLDIRCQIEPCEQETVVVLSSEGPSGPALVQ